MAIEKTLGFYRRSTQKKLYSQKCDLVYKYAYDTASYLLQAVRYIHRNPLQSGLADRLNVYKWSSHKGYISIAKKWDWLHKNYILSLLSKNRKDWLRYYRKWVSVYDIAVSDILKMRRGKMNEARNVVIYLARRLRRDTLKEIGAQFGIDSDSTVSSVMERMKKKLAGDRKLSLRLDKIAGSITKS